MAEGLPIALMPDDFTSSGPYVAWTDYPGTNAYATTAHQMYTDWMSGYNDHHFRIHVPNGVVVGTVLPANGEADAPNVAGFSFDCNGTPVIGQTDLFNFTGGLFVGRPMTCTQTVSDGMLHMVVRLQGVNLGSNPECAVPCYQATNTGVGNLLAGLVVSATPTQAPPAKPATTSVLDLAEPRR